MSTTVITDARNAARSLADDAERVGLKVDANAIRAAIRSGVSDAEIATAVLCLRSRASGAAEVLAHVGRADESDRASDVHFNCGAVLRDLGFGRAA